MRLHRNLIVLSFSYLVSCRPAQTPTGPSVAVSTVYQYPPPTYVENIAVRSNGNLVHVLLDRPEVYEINPLVPNATPTLLKKFNGASHVTGTIEVAPDVFAIILSESNVVLGGALGTFSLWTVDLNGGTSNPKWTKISKSVRAGLLNGLTNLGTDSVLASDTFYGQVWTFNLRTGAASVTIKAGELKGNPTLNVALGLNGVRTFGKYLYYTNTLGALGRAPIDNSTGRLTGPSELISSSVSGVDDFIITPDGKEAFVAGQFSNEILKVDLTKKESVQVVVGSINSGVVLAPCALAFGRAKGDEGTLYVVTAGQGRLGTPPDAKLGGTILALKWK